MQENKKFLNFNTLLVWFGIILIMLVLLNTGLQKESIIIDQTVLKGLVKENAITNNKMELIDNKILIGKFESHSDEKEKNGKNIQSFKLTINPQFDVDLIQFLKQNNINISYKETEQMSRLLIIYLFIALSLYLIYFFMFKKGSGSATSPFSFAKSKFQRINPENITTNLSQVAGIDEVKSEVEQIVDFLKNPLKYRQLGAEIPKGVLLSGPPGTGKTLIAKAIAKEANVPFLTGSGSGFVEMFVGVGASRVRDLFDEARKLSPCIIFIDELDAIGKQRGGISSGGNDEREQTLNQLLVEMDGFSENSGIIVIAATNRPDVLDSAFTRPGRFDRKVTVSLPNKEGRKDILKIHAQKKKNIPLSNDVDFDIIARGTPGFSGAELANLVNEAALEAVKTNSSSVNFSHFEHAKDKILMGLEQKNLVFSQSERYNTSIHECGHTIINVIYKDVLDPIHKVSIVPRGQAAGVTQTLPLDDGSYNYSDEKCNKMIQMLMGGRIAEEIFFHKKTTGASSDIDRATMIARNMVYSWGMSKLGFINIETSQSRDKFSEETRSIADTLIKEILDTNYKEARRLLELNKPAIESLALLLLDKETIDSTTVYSHLDNLLK